MKLPLLRLLFCVIVTISLFSLTTKDALATNCSVTSSTANLKTGDNITIHVTDLPYSNQEYKVTLFSLQDNSEPTVHTFTATSKNPPDQTFPIPSNITSGKYHLYIQINREAPVSGFAICARNLNITNEGGGSPPPSNIAICEYKISPDKKSVFIAGKQLKPDSPYTVYAEGFSLGAFKSDDKGLGGNVFKIDKADKIATYTIKDDKGGPTACTKNDNLVAPGVEIKPGMNLCAPTPIPGQAPQAATECKTALGTIPIDVTNFTQKVLTIALGLAGGIALIFMVYGSIKILISSGDPKKVGDGRDIIVAAVAGLLFLIFSVLILRYVGITLLPTNPF